MNVVSFETAKRLKEAGFPQPEKYYTKGEWFYLSRVCLLCAHDIEDRVTSSNCLAPSATDILKELGKSFHLYYNEKSNGWACWEQSMSSANDRFHDNPAEACAAAWLAKNENA